MDCKKQDDMTDDEFENYYGNNGGENCQYYDEIPYLFENLYKE